MAKIINGVSLPNIPWQDRPEGCENTVWRYSQNPIIKRNPAKGCQRVFNSAVVPWGDEFIGVFRADTTITTPNLHVGHSKDGINWEIEVDAIDWRDENGEPFTSSYYYDPRVTWIEDAYYVMWCTEQGGPVLGLARPPISRTSPVCPTSPCPSTVTAFPSPVR